MVQSSLFMKLLLMNCCFSNLLFRYLQTNKKIKKSCSFENLHTSFAASSSKSRCLFLYPPPKKKKHACFLTKPKKKNTAPPAPPAANRPTSSTTNNDDGAKVQRSIDSSRAKVGRSSPGDLTSKFCTIQVLLLRLGISALITYILG